MGEGVLQSAGKVVEKATLSHGTFQQAGYRASAPFTNGAPLSAQDQPVRLETLSGAWVKVVASRIIDCNFSVGMQHYFGYCDS